MTKSELQMTNEKKGYVLISVLVIMMILVAMMYFFADALFSEMAISRNQKSATQAFHLAEAGIQDAIWRIQNDNGVRTEFLKSDGLSEFPGTLALLPNGSYTVKIENTAAAVANITATGLMQIGLKTAQRKISTHVYQATANGPYTQDGGLFVGGPDPGNIYLHNLTYTYDAGYDQSSILGGGNIDIGNADIEVSKDILANGDIDEQNSTITLPPPDPLAIPPFPGGVMEDNYPTDFMLPEFTKIATLKATAQAQNQFYTAAEFANLIKTQTTFNGVVYVGGAGGVEIKNKNLTFNGALVSEGSINMVNANVDINHSGPSGLVTLGSLDIVNTNLNVEGLVYIGIDTTASVNANITATGAILAHNFWANNINLKINLKKDWVNETLEGGAPPPVIKMEHWEEEY